MSCGEVSTLTTVHSINPRFLINGVKSSLTAGGFLWSWLGSGEHFLASENIPDRILTAFYSTLTGPNLIGIATPPNRITLLLDFSRPTILDFSKLPTTGRASPRPSFFEGIRRPGRAVGSGAGERENAPIEAQFSQNLNQKIVKNLPKKFTKKWCAL